MRYLTVDQVLEINRTVLGDRSTLARNHAFEDGNKRTALLATVIFYSLNGWLLDLEQGEAVSLAVDAAEGHLDADELALLLKGRATEISLLFDPDED